MARQQGRTRTVPDLADLPDNSQVTFTKRTLPIADEAESLPTADDFESAPWQVEVQVDGGWSVVGQSPIRPYPVDLSAEYGPGKYRVTPMPDGRKPLAELSQILMIGQRPTPTATPAAPVQVAQPAAAPANPIDSFVTMQANLALEREKREQREREEERQRRIERENREEQERIREREERRERAAREDARWDRALGLVTPIIPKIMEKMLTPPERDGKLMEIVVGLAQQKTTPPPDPFDQYARMKIRQKMIRDLDADDEDDDDKDNGDLTPRDMMSIAKDTLPPLVRAIKGQPEPAPTGNPLHNPEALKSAIVQDPNKALETISALVAQHPEYAGALKDTIDHGLQAAGVRPDGKPVRKLRAAEGE